MRNLTNRVILIVLVVVLAVWIDFNQKISITNPFTQKPLWSRDVSPRLGLDLRGGLQVVLEADVPEGTVITKEQMETARIILENRTNALGVNESVLQVAGSNRIVGEFPDAANPDSIKASFGETGRLEFVDFGHTRVPAGTVVQTDVDGGVATDLNNADPAQPIIYHTVMTGDKIASALVAKDAYGRNAIDFTLTAEGAVIFSDHTSTHSQQYLGIVLDKTVISAPQINEPITSGSGQITGDFTNEAANTLAIQLRYGSLPIPFKIVESRVVGPTLGQDSLEKSLIAGLVGIIIVFLFMGIYYRLPGILADVSIIIYGLIAFAVFKYIPITLTLAGVAGFLLSTGAALDANILIFERMKEELRAGRTLRNAVDLGWTRAWSSIRDSNLATIITSIILFWFGSSFGATIVKGFALTLALGVGISLFTAILVTRTLLNLVLKVIKPGDENLKWFGL
ncbi:MAG: protein translocase subunit SecD [Anaerolineae bacterium CFX3]|nr:Protein translocase subunit SecDF [Anaerolineales bacterium]MCC7511614.1 protein translocase subunit SecD [Anaerolineae bacterium]MCE7906321.1 protein translocase subunit SecD [Anaerolineae bacterium CFX3]OQY84153.1 MAG: protein translocase subunit SecD [Anaerolineae bacterium UTCFX3]GER79973.1 translocase subunit SecD [Candidatus Denitrolinea symbiosum]